MTQWTVAYQASLPMRFPRQENWNGLPFSSLGDLPDPGVQTCVSPALQVDPLPLSHLGSPKLLYVAKYVHYVGSL